MPHNLQSAAHYMNMNLYTRRKLSVLVDTVAQLKAERQCIGGHSGAAEGGTAESKRRPNEYFKLKEKYFMPSNKL
jgi:hypothetical protein